MKALTDAYIRGLKPVAHRIEIADPSCRGLCLRITTAGAKSFSFRARPPGGGTVERLTLGAYPDLTLRDARARADKLRQQIVVRKNPFTLRREASARSFAALAERYVAEHARRHKRSAAKDERNLRLHILPRWKGRDFATITRADVIALVERLVSGGKPILANHVQRLISKIFAFGMDVALAEQNPAARLRLRGATRAKSRVLTDDEIRLFWKCSVGPAGLALRLVLATGVRPGEAAGLARTELEFDAKAPVAWTVPADRSKNGRPHFVPLSPLASAIVCEALELAGDHAFVFRSRAARGHIDSSALANFMQALSAGWPADEPGATSWQADAPTPHDLRRTCATRLAAAGVPGEDIAAILNHVRSDVTGKHYDYDMYRRAAEKRALERWSRILRAIIDRSPASKVVPLRG